ncbi:hypothetical protein ACHAXS_004991 [Conticribra weissflogii]
MCLCYRKRLLDPEDACNGCCHPFLVEHAMSCTRQQNRNGSLWLNFPVESAMLARNLKFSLGAKQISPQAKRLPTSPLPILTTTLASSPTTMPLSTDSG